MEVELVDDLRVALSPWHSSESFKELYIFLLGNLLPNMPRPTSTRADRALQRAPRYWQHLGPSALRGVDLSQFDHGEGRYTLMSCEAADFDLPYP
jgi:hypothetical protein